MKGSKKKFAISKYLQIALNVFVTLLATFILCLCLVPGDFPIIPRVLVVIFWGTMIGFFICEIIDEIKKVKREEEEER